MIELLAPFPNYESVKVIFESGADAGYLGLKSFNARLRAKNFSFDELAETVKYAHSQQKKIFAALNTLVPNKEIKKLIIFLELLSELKTDAVIIQDLGVLNIINRYFPDLTIHASTQMLLYGRSGVDFAADNNIKRIILPRELSFKEISELDKYAFEKNIELEMFVNGSMCYSISGICNFSKVYYDKSGNRGECIQPCRHKFKTNSNSYEKSFFSMSDLCLLPNIKEIMSLKSMKSFKIEGRMKNVFYIKDIVSSYRKVIDAVNSGNNSFEKIIEEEVEKIKSLSGRDVSSGYFNFPDCSNNLFSEKNPEMYMNAGKIKYVSGNKIFFVPLLAFDKNDLFKLEKPKNKYRDSVKLLEIYDKRYKKKFDYTLPGQEVILIFNKSVSKSDSIYVCRKISIEKNDALKKKTSKIIIDKLKTEDIFNQIVISEKNDCLQYNKFIYEFCDWQKNNNITLKQNNYAFTNINNSFFEFVKNNRKQIGDILIVLPPEICGTKNITNMIIELLKNNIYKFIVFSIPQLYFIKNHFFGFNDKIELIAGHNIYVLNTQSAYFLRRIGVTGKIIDNYEMTDAELHLPLKEIIIKNYKIPLFTSRSISCDLINEKQVIYKNDVIEIEKNNSLYLFFRNESNSEI